MKLIDDKGRLLGTINIIDALVVLLVLAVAGAGTALVLGGDNQPANATQALTDNTTTVATFEITGVQPYVADAITEGRIGTDSITAVENKSVRPTEVIVRDQNGTLHERQHPRKQTVTLRVSLNTTTTDEDITFQDKPLEVGRQLTLDFGHVTVKGTVTNLASDN
ncbi:DUF4330 domain-containing protein [Halorussus sp. MSC15.2]|uniref:DUF4330 domain-containing protein n=1 Tax=Halorussus sp. MSC15.2 TaxID=2283638 RepID=UPI0013D77EFD|nr:DUF4330 domain-containing protein [Halorussus sp. MSC15.2]NEU55646.1 DUF4330 domain-containing protein [Halorussus sp. MSC15.2]